MGWNRPLEASGGMGTALEMLQRRKRGQLQVRLKSTNGSRTISWFTQHLTCFLETEIMAGREWSWDRHKDGWTPTELFRVPLFIRKGQAPVFAYDCLVSPSNIPPHKSVEKLPASQKDYNSKELLYGIHVMWGRPEISINLIFLLTDVPLLNFSFYHNLMLLF